MQEWSKDQLHSRPRVFENGRKICEAEVHN